MKLIYSVVLVALGLMSTALQAQVDILPKGHAPFEKHLDRGTDYRSMLGVEITTPPEFPVRTMAEWEEIQALVITWAGFERILKQIAFHAKEQCEVIIIAESNSAVLNYLNSSNAGGPAFDNLDNITIINDYFDSIWGRDYGAHTIYRDDVDELLLVDWIYNRNRPSDDLVPVTIAQHFGLPLYTTTEEPYDLMATGGNFMADGLGTAFSSELIADENSGGNTWWGATYPNHSEAEINGILSDFMGIDTYINMDVLPYDGIHHIDMHMKLLDEETIIIGQYPNGVADGPQIEANMEYVLNNYNSAFGTPYDIVRVQMPPENGAYPNTSGDYRTYTNMVFVNKTVLVPIYEEQYDTPALEIIEAELPGYNVVGIQCNDIIQLSGAIHCITKAVGVSDPLLIVHDHLDDTEETLIDYQVEATIKHMDDIANAAVLYRVDGGPYTSLEMTLTQATEDLWMTAIPAQSVGAVVDYYIDATANSGKNQVRPIVAPEGNWTFEVLGSSVGVNEINELSPFSEIYPNPASAITVIRLDLPSNENISLKLLDMTGREVISIYEGTSSLGEQKYFIDASALSSGAYFVSLTIEGQNFSQRLMVR